MDGWEAISRTLHERYGPEQYHYGTIVGYQLGGPDPLDGISVYAHPGPPEHWHFVSFGMTELHEKESDNPDVSGWGFELTLRLARRPDDTEPPGGALEMLQSLARYVFDSGNMLHPGEHIQYPNPSTRLHGALFVPDPELPPIQTPNGEVGFLQSVGITADELALCKHWSGDGLLGLLTEQNPLLVTESTRPSVLDDPVLAARAQEGIDRDGSRYGVMVVDHLDWTTGADGGVTLAISNRAAPDLCDALRHRIRHGRPFTLSHNGDSAVFTLAPGPAAGWTTSSDPDSSRTLHAVLPSEHAHRAAEMFPTTPGRHPFPGIPGLTLDLVT